jgi:hypothetical protein
MDLFQQPQDGLRKTEVPHTDTCPFVNLPETGRVRWSEILARSLRGKSAIDGESELLDNRLRKLIANGVRRVLLNLTDLTQVDSSGVGVIIDTYVFP